MSTEWITDRLPTAEDALGDTVLVSYDELSICFARYDHVKPNQPWQPLPAPYVKPKRWTVEWDCKRKAYEIRFNHHFLCTLPELCVDEIAQRIENLFNEVMP
jgi:hypothetical protein